MATNEHITPTTDFTPAEELVINDIDTLKVLADPLRLRIRELMAKPCTVKQVAEALDIPPTKLYYHINLLEKHGLIVIVDTRLVSGIVEKRYQIAARSIRVSRSLLSPTSEDLESSVGVTFGTFVDDMQTDLINSIRDGQVAIAEEAEAHKALSMTTTLMTLTETQAKELYERLAELLKEYHAASEAQFDNFNTRDDLHIYRMFHALFPSSRKPHPNDD